jgi:hypothetical protein
MSSQRAQTAAVSMIRVQKYQTILQKMYGGGGGKFATLAAAKPNVL